MKFIIELSICLGILAIDRFTKLWTRSQEWGQLNSGGILGVIPGNVWHMVIFILIGLWLWIHTRVVSTRERIGWFIIWSAGLSNYIDRVIWGGVWDWIYYPYISVVGNIADIMLGIGAVWLLIHYANKNHI